MGSKVTTHDLTKEQKESSMVLVVGGGYGGVGCALLLKETGVPFVLVDPKEYFFHRVAALRALVRGGAWAQATAIPFRKTFGDSFKKGHVKRINFKKKRATLCKGGGKVTFTHLVLATGSKGGFPARTSARKVKELHRTFEDSAAEIEKSEWVLVVGGGPEGVEVAAEVKTMHPKKRVTVVHAGQALLSRVNLGADITQAFREKCHDALKLVGVEVILGQRICNMTSVVCRMKGKHELRTVKFDMYEPDIVLDCTGLSPDKDLLEKTDNADKLDPRGYLKVSLSLKVEGLEDAYAVGDCTTAPGGKMSEMAEAQAICVCQNILNRMAGKEEEVNYEPPFSGMLLSVGANAGVGVHNGWSMPSAVVAMMKSRGLYCAKYWAAMGQTMPAID